NQGVQGLERPSENATIVREMRHMIEICVEQVEISDLWVFQLLLQLEFHAAAEGVLDLKSDQPLINKIPDRMRQALFQAGGQRLPAYTMREKLEALIPLVLGKSVHDHRNSNAIQRLHRRHILLLGERVAKIEGEKIQVIIRSQRIAVEFHVAANDRIAACLNR